MQVPDEPVISARQTAIMLHIHANTLRRWTMEGKIQRWPPFNRGQWLYRRRDVESLCRKYEARDSQPNLESLYEDKSREMNTGDIVWKVSIKSPHRLMYISPSVAKILGYSVEEAMATHLQNAFSSSSIGRLGKIMAEELPKLDSLDEDFPQIPELDLELLHKNGSVVPVKVGFSYVHNTDGQPEAILALARLKAAGSFRGAPERENVNLITPAENP